MKKLLMIFALCALCGSAFAAVTLTDWKVGYIGKDEFSKEPLMRDLNSVGFDFQVEAHPDKVHEAFFVADNVSGWMYVEDNTFKVNITGFDGIRTDLPNDVDTLIVTLLGEDDSWITYYLNTYTGPGIYDFGSDVVKNSSNLSDGDFFTGANIIMGRTLGNGGVKVAGIPIDSSGSVQFIVSDAAVPEPSSLLALAFGGVGTAMLISRKR